MSSTDSKLHIYDNTNKVWRKALSTTTGVLKSETTLDKTGLATDTLQTSGNASLSSIDSKITACDTGSVTVTSSALPTGGATSANQSTANASLSSIDGKITACDTGNVVVSNITTCDTGNISGSVSVSNNTDPATATLQTAGNASLTVMEGSHYADGDPIAAADTGILMMGRNGTNAAKPIHITNNGDVEVEIADFVKGQATMATSFPVVLASDQSVLNININSTSNSGSYANLANNVTINTGSNSSVVDISNMSIGNLFYSDSSTLSADALEIQVSTDGTNYFRYMDIFPFDNGSGVRTYTETNIKLHGLTHLRLLNTSITDNYTNVISTIVGSP